MISYTKTSVRRFVSVPTVNVLILIKELAPAGEDILYWFN
jgi:hypothetical protein